MFFYVGDVFWCSGSSLYFNDVIFFGDIEFRCGYYYEVGVFVDVIVGSGEWGGG